MLASTVEEKRPIATNGALYMYKVLEDGDVKRLVEKMTGEKVLNFAYHNVARLDYFMSKIAKASSDFNTDAAIPTGNTQDIKLLAYRKAVICLLDDCKDIIKSANGGTKINPSVSIFPDIVQVPDPKRQKINNAGGNNQNNDNGGNNQNNHNGGNGYWDNGRGNTRETMGVATPIIKGMETG